VLGAEELDDTLLELEEVLDLEEELDDELEELLQDEFILTSRFAGFLIIAQIIAS